MSDTQQAPVKNTRTLVGNYGAFLDEFEALLTGNEIIMAARAHWFAEDEKAAAETAA